MEAVGAVQDLHAAMVSVGGEKFTPTVPDKELKLLETE